MAAVPAQARISALHSSFGPHPARSPALGSRYSRANRDSDDCTWNCTGGVVCQKAAQLIPDSARSVGEGAREGDKPAAGDQAANYAACNRVRAAAGAHVDAKQ